MNNYQFNERMRLAGKPIKGKQLKSKVGTIGEKEKKRRLKQLNKKNENCVPECNHAEPHE